MASNIEEALSDFKNSIAGIDFKAYNPNSPEFQSALSIGLMWYLLCEASDECPTDMNTRKPTNGKHDDIYDELFDAKKYYQKYLDTSDMNFKTMARDELRHAEILIKKANAKLPSGEEKAKIKEYENELRQIMSEITK